MIIAGTHGRIIGLWVLVWRSVAVTAPVPFSDSRATAAAAAAAAICYARVCALRLAADWGPAVLSIHSFDERSIYRIVVV